MMGTTYTDISPPESVLVFLTHGRSQHIINSFMEDSVGEQYSA